MTAAAIDVTKIIDLISDAAPWGCLDRATLFVSLEAHEKLSAFARKHALYPWREGEGLQVLGCPALVSSELTGMDILWEVAETNGPS